jgi:uncharacterized protein involved in exopolysaccharide biosynthesis
MRRCVDPSAHEARTVRGNAMTLLQRLLTLPLLYLAMAVVLGCFAGAVLMSIYERYDR